jgi:hypothetical protein
MVNLPAIADPTVALPNIVVADLAQQLGVLGECVAGARSRGIPICSLPGVTQVVVLIYQSHLCAKPVSGLNGEHIDDPQSGLTQVVADRKVWVIEARERPESRSSTPPILESQLVVAAKGFWTYCR